MNKQQTNNPNHSTGPTTEAGKFESSKNALKHGLTSESIDRFPAAIREEYRAFLAQCYAEFQPQTFTETDYLEQYAFSRFQFQRGQVMLSTVYNDLAADPTNELLEKRYAKLFRHVKALERLANNALKELRIFISDRLQAVELDAQLPDCAAGISFPVTFPAHRLLEKKQFRKTANQLTLRFVQDLIARNALVPVPQNQPEPQAA